MTNSSTNILLANCRSNFDIHFCYFANICGLISTGVWFAVLVPQLFRNFRRRSVEGLSLGWALANFTAAFNNTFFVFYVKTLPLYAKVSAVYMPTLEIIMLGQFLVFTPYSMAKLILAVVCCFIWACLIIAQSVWTIYSVLEWLSITLWSVETFFQVFTNIDRRSTYGLSTTMVVLTTCGKTTDFLSTYILVLPMQYVIMAYFSSSVAFINTLQVIWYWNKIPAESTFADTAASSSAQHGDDETADIPIRDEEADLDQNIVTPDGSPNIGQITLDKYGRYSLETSRGCHVIRVILFVTFSLMLVGFCAALVWCTGNWISLLAPLSVAVIIAGYYGFVRSLLKELLIDKLRKVFKFKGPPLAESHAAKD